MNLFGKLLSKLDGLHYPQEYLCFAKEGFEQPLYAYIVAGDKIIKDITNDHLFTGYSPLVFALHTLPEDPTLSDEIEMIYAMHSMQANELFEKKDALARLSLKLIKKQPVDGIVIHYYEGKYGEHRFLPAVQQKIIQLYNRMYNKKPGNIFLPGNLYTQVQIAYAMPRIISLITVEENGLYNLFPTDLHGPLNQKFYICSLRHEGRACRQVQDAGKIVISQVNADSYKTVYSLGKNHMQDLKPKENFPISDARSAVFGLPLPAAALLYRELELTDSFIHGIHKFLLFRIASNHRVKDDRATLAHVHNCYATWRFNNELSSNFLLR